MKSKEKILDGKSLSTRLLEKLKEKILKEDITPCFAMIVVGDDKPTKSYIKSKESACSIVGIKSYTYNYPSKVSKETLIEKIEELNGDKNINGILLQMPLPEHLNAQEIIEHINVDKDVDGLTSTNMGRLVLGMKGFVPCTAKGIDILLSEYNISVEGKNVVIVGRSNIVGKPLANLLINRHATVEVCNSKTKDLKEKLKRADILITAAGVKHLVGPEDIKSGAVVLDVGITKENGKLYGDVDFENVEDVRFITPVPGGVGPMTVYSLMLNIYTAYLIDKVK